MINIAVLCIIRSRKICIASLGKKSQSNDSSWWSASLSE